MIPTHFRCQLHDVELPLDQYQQHCNEQHNGLPVRVRLTERRCPHGLPITVMLMACCVAE